MTDADLSDFLGITDLSAELQAKFIAALTPERRAVFERMAQVTAEIHLWEAGVGPKPAGVFLCGPKQIRRAGRA